MPRHSILVLATLAALLAMAPSSVFATTPLPTTVVADASPPPRGGDGPTTTVVEPSVEPVPSLAPAPQATATPQPSVAPAPEHESTARLVSSESQSRPTVDRPGARDRTRPRPARSTSAVPSRSPDVAPGSGGTGTPGSSTDDRYPSSLWLVLIWGMAAVGAVGLVGTTWLLVARHREQVVAGTAEVDTHLAIGTIPAVDRRAVRRARLRQTDDPIVSGLGLDDQVRAAASPRPRRGGRPRP